jgi:DNA-binding CsgD family transcriptional regulator
MSGIVPAVLSRERKCPDTSDTSRAREVSDVSVLVNREGNLSLRSLRCGFAFTGSRPGVSPKRGVANYAIRPMLRFKGASFYRMSSTTPLPTPGPLTHREMEVLQLIADGLTTKRIAARLCLSVETVKSHLGAIYAKLGADSRAHAVAIGFRQGLTRPRRSRPRAAPGRTRRMSAAHRPRGRSYPAGEVVGGGATAALFFPPPLLPLRCVDTHSYWNPEFATIRRR